MSNKNYRNYRNDYKSAEIQEQEKVELESVVIESEVSVIEPVKPVAEAPKIDRGVVANCQRLNVREKPTVKADVVWVLVVGEIVVIDKSKSNKNFYKIITESGTEGFCMKKFITLKP